MFESESNSNDFIGVYKNCISEDDCKKIIEESEEFFSSPSTVHVQGNELNRKDRIAFAEAKGSMPYTYASVSTALQMGMNLYCQEYFILKQINATSSEIKVQKTSKREGYHGWHCEAGSASSSRRCLAWMVYLNTLPDGEGETEFLWQCKRFKPEAGTLLIWPAAWTHTHRGNPVYTQDKYIATGWFYHVGQ